MKVISLNTWGGRAGKEGLLNFFKSHADTDIFCLQEIWRAAYEHLMETPAGGSKLDYDQIMVHGMQEISAAMPNHEPYFRPANRDNYGLMMLVKKEIVVLEEADIFVHKERGYIPTGDAGFHARNVQYVTVITSAGNRTIMNFYGLWNGKGKGDSADRLLQSERIIDFIKDLPVPYVLCGDFNLLPESESLAKLEVHGLRNLIKEYDVTSTRTSHYTKEQKFADYVFVSKDIAVKGFKVLPDEVSDHSPLMLEFQ